MTELTTSIDQQARLVTDHAQTLARFAVAAAVPFVWSATPLQRGFSVALMADQRVGVVFDRLGAQITVWEDGGPVQPWHGVPEFAMLWEFLAGLLGFDLAPAGGEPR